MGVTTYRPPADFCTCALVVGGGDPILVPLIEISSIGGVIRYDIDLKQHDYIDVTVRIPGRKDLTLFAHVVNAKGDEVRLRWLHFDPGEEAQLQGRLEERFAGLEGIEVGDATRSHFAWRQEAGTRRIVRPRAGSAKADPIDEALPPETGTKHKTRRVVRPRSTTTGDESAPSEAAEQPALAPKGEATGESSGSRQVTKPRKPGAPAPAGEDDEYTAQDATPTAQAQAAAQATEAPADPTSNWRQRAPQAPAGGNIAIVGTERFAKVAPKPAGDDADDGEGHKDAESLRILGRSRTVQASELAARHDKVRVLNMSTIKELIRESTAEAVASFNTGMSPEELQAEVTKRVDEQLKTFKSEKEDAAARADRLERELAAAQELVAKERDRAIMANRFTVSESGMIDLQQRLERMVAAAGRLGGVDDQIAEDFRNMVSRVLDDEREKIAEAARKAQAETIDLLERKVARLSGNLDEAQKDRDRHRRALAKIEASGGIGIANIMEAGLDDEDPDKERKLLLMKEIADQNREMREHYEKVHGELPKARRRVPVKPLPEPAEHNDRRVSEPPVSDTDEHGHVVDPLPPAAALDTADDNDDGELPPNPDDLPWQGPPPDEDEDSDAPVKKMKVSVQDAAAKAPPLHITRGSADDGEDRTATVPDEDEVDRTATESDDDHPDPVGVGVDGEPVIDPDDLPWEGPPEASDDDTDSPIKKIKASQSFEPPPLERGGG